MTCKDCLHYPACAEMFKKAWGELPETGEGAERCETFADHSRYVVREKGEWILTDAELAEMSCSRCGFTYYGVHDYECMSGFCPDCGCDMRKEC